MLVFIVLWPYLLTTKLRCLHKNKIGHTSAHYLAQSVRDCTQTQIYVLKQIQFSRDLNRRYFLHTRFDFKKSGKLQHNVFPNFDSIFLLFEGRMVCLRVFMHLCSKLCKMFSRIEKCRIFKNRIADVIICETPTL